MSQQKTYCYAIRLRETPHYSHTPCLEELPDRMGVNHVDELHKVAQKGIWK